jgi:peroxiredoxin
MTKAEKTICYKRAYIQRQTLHLLILALTLILAHPKAALSESALMIGDPAPRVTMNDLAGMKMTIPDSVRGKVVIIHFWAEGCSSCAREMPALESLYAEYKSKGLIVVAVNVGQQTNAVSAFIRKMGLSYPVVLDPESTAAGSYGVFGLPRTFFLDRTGRIKYKILGEASEKTLKKLVLKIL